MGRKLTSYNGEDCIYTPREMAKAIIDKLNPQGIILEPCMGDGGFTDIFTEKGFSFEWCEISKGVDYFKKETTNAEWVITNPPFSNLIKRSSHLATFFCTHILILQKNVLPLQSKRI